MFETLEGMLDRGGSCLLHQSCKTNCHPNREIQLGISGSPCQPYSQKRGSKRWSCGGVASHPKHSTSMDSVIAWYTKYEPHASVTEQVMGFKMKTSNEISESPMKQPLVSRLICFFFFEKKQIKTIVDSRLLHSKLKI